MKKFLGNIHPQRNLIIKLVDCHSSTCDFLKCNIDGGGRGSPNLFTSGRLFQDHNGAFLGGFVAYLDTKDTLHAKLVVVMMM
uniref:RNase H type-1 domain-containing protein n=1 Tax=Cajanus cajan TaxID=3821 RepID=A0A151R4I7_CAJCA|nr:hypothetical protein KK1_041382 [Cajanus cajan]